MTDEITLKNGQRIKVGAPPSPPTDPKKKELYDQLIDTVLQHAFTKSAAGPGRGMDNLPDPPEIVLMDKGQLYREIGNCIDTWGKGIIGHARDEEEKVAKPPARGTAEDDADWNQQAADEADRRAAEGEESCGCLADCCGVPHKKKDHKTKIGVTPEEI